MLHAAENDIQLKAIAGAEQSQASASQRVWKLYLNLAANVDMGHNTRFFVDGHITSVPQQTNFALSTLPAEAPGRLRQVKINEMFQSVSLLTGVETHALLSSPSFQLKPLIAAGFTAPAEPQQDRFYGQWYGGFRLKDTRTPQAERSIAYPAHFDITFGQNALLSCLCGVTWRFSAFYPVPGAEWLSIFGESYMQLRRGSNRDFYHIGFGLDVVKAVGALGIDVQSPFKKK
jgi:hypothetical protein